MRFIPRVATPRSIFAVLKRAASSLFSRIASPNYPEARRKQPDWTDALILDKEGKIVGNLANVILILREAPEWKGVLGYDEFNARVVIRRAPAIRR